MSILKKVIKAVKKIFGISTKRPKSNKARKTKFKKTSPLRSRRLSVNPAKVKNSRSKSIPKSSGSVKLSKDKKVPVIKSSVPKKTTVIKKSTKIPALPVGEITHYFDRIKVCVIRIDQGFIKKGDRLLIKGNGPGLTQVVASLQIENEDVPMGKKGQLVGLKVTKAVSVKDVVFKLPQNG